MLSKVHAAALRGVEASPVEMEVHVGPGEKCIIVVGLPAAHVSGSHSVSVSRSSDLDVSLRAMRGAFRLHFRAQTRPSKPTRQPNTPKSQHHAGQ